MAKPELKPKAPSLDIFSVEHGDSIAVFFHLVLPKPDIQEVLVDADGLGPSAFISCFVNGASWVPPLFYD